MKQYTYQIRTDPIVPEHLASLAAALGYVVTKKGAYFGRASVPQLLSDLAAAYAADPASVESAFRELGVSSPAD